MDIQVIKVHGSNNDFYLIDEMNGNLPITEEERSALSLAVCRRTKEEQRHLCVETDFVV